MSRLKEKRGKKPFVYFPLYGCFLVTGSCEKEIEQYKGKMKQVFDMTDLGNLSYFIGMELLST